MKSSQFLALTALLGLAGTVSAAWTRLPYEESKPINLAAKAITGTKIIASNGVENAGALLMGDPAASAHISGGKSEFTLQLSKQHVVGLVTFTNDGAEGKVTCAGSSDEKNWTNLGTAVFSGSDRMVTVSFANAQAKYLSVSFESPQGGTIRALEVFGAAMARDFTLKSSPDSTVNVNLTASPGGARPIYAFPTPSNAGELDYRYNVFRFPNTGDKYRTVIYDLGSPRTLREFSSSYSQHPVRLDVFAFSELPETKDWRGKMTLDPNIFDSTRPVVSGEDSRGVGHIKLVPSKPVVARYIALRFEPNYLHAGNDSPLGELAAVVFGSSELTAGGSFTISCINVGAGGFSVGPGNGNGDTGNTGNTGNPDQSTPNDQGGPPYLPGTPGSPPANTGGIGGVGTGSANPAVPGGNVNVKVGAAGGGGGGGTTNPPSGGPTSGSP